MGKEWSDREAVVGSRPSVVAGGRPSQGFLRALGDLPSTGSGQAVVRLPNFCETNRKGH